MYSCKCEIKLKGASAENIKKPANNAHERARALREKRALQRQEHMVEALARLCFHRHRHRHSLADTMLLRVDWRSP